MTFAMMWTHGNHVLATADSSVTRRGVGTSGPNPFGLQPTVPGHVVSDEALKLYLLPVGICLVAAGLEEPILRFADLLRERLVQGGQLPNAIQSCGSLAADRGAFEVLVGVVEDDRPAIWKWRSTEPGAAPARVAGDVIGSVPHEMRGGLLDSALSVPCDRPAVGALLSLQAAVHLLLMQHPDLMHRSLSGMLSGAVISRNGAQFAPDTLWVTTHHELLDSPVCEPGTIGLISSQLRENAHYLWSSHHAGEHAGASIFFNGWAPETEEWLARWETQLDDGRLSPQVVAFLHVNRRVAFLVGGLRGPNPAVSFATGPVAIRFTDDSAFAYRKAMRDATGAILVQWYPGSTEGGTPDVGATE